MKTLKEGNLQITFNGAIRARKFDDSNHGLSHCMKAVDFIVEFSDRYLFIEVKNPQSPQAPDKNRDDFIKEFKSAEMDGSLIRKYRDSFLYEWASGRSGKPVDYLVLIALDTLDESLLSNRADELSRNLPVKGAQWAQSWRREIVRKSGVFNIASWERHFPEYPITVL